MALGERRRWSVAVVGCGIGRAHIAGYRSHPDKFQVVALCDIDETALAQASPLGRLLEPDEVAEAIVFLASSGAAAISGQAMVIDGGGIQA